MSERRVSGWFVLSAVFLVAVFGLFFTFTERKTWPEQRVELAATDMRLAPPASTLWCEALALQSDHPFVAYQLSKGARINSKHLTRQKVNLQLRPGTSAHTNSVKLKYFLLASSVVEMVACSSAEGALLMVFKGDEDVQKCLQSLSRESFDLSSELSDSEEDSSDESEEVDLLTISQTSQRLKNKYCSSLLKYYHVDADFLDESPMFCSSGVRVKNPFKLNITTSDYYVIAVVNTNRRVPNQIDLQLLLDRSRYTVHKSGQTFDMCSLSTTCTIGLGFGTSDRVLVWIPEEDNAGRSSFVVRTRCKPRLAVFAILSVFLPLMVFLVVAFVVRADRGRIRSLYQGRSAARSRQHQQRTAEPLLQETVPAINNSVLRNDIAHEETPQMIVVDEELPPPYHTLYEAPPPYSGLKTEEAK